MGKSSNRRETGRTENKRNSEEKYRNTRKTWRMTGNRRDRERERE